MADNLITKLGRSIMAATSAFRQEFMSTGTDETGSLSFDSPEARMIRYSILWAFFENTAYDKVHRWASSLKASYGLYRYTRHIYNPSTRIGRFWSTHLMGGSLDPRAGDGSVVQSALPIIIPPENTKGTALRTSLSTLWGDSNWNQKKDLFTLLGPTLGDVFVQITDDVARQKVYLEVVHPSLITDLLLDPFGNVKGYTLEQGIDDPIKPGKLAEYKEVCRRGEGDLVVFETYLNDQPFGFNGKPESWGEPYGFVPMVFVPHIDVGQQFGWAEIHPSLSKIRECDDLASKLSDHIRKSVDPAWLFNFAKPKQTADTTVPPPEETTSRPYGGREEVPAFYIPNENARGQALLADLNYEGVIRHLAEMVSELEREYPELRYDNMRLEGAVSGETLRIARQPAEAKVLKARASYDAAMVRAHNMAIAVGGFRGLPGYEGFGLESYDLGDLKHTIGERPVFNVNKADELAEEKIFWETAKVAQESGVSLPGYLKLHGWSDEKISLVLTGDESGDYDELIEEEQEFEQPSSADQSGLTSDTDDNAEQPGGGSGLVPEEDASRPQQSSRRESS